MIAVFDCMVYLQGVARSNGPASGCFDMVRNRDVRLYLSNETLAEIEDVVTRPKFRKRFQHLSDKMIEEFLFEIIGLAVIFPKVKTHYQFPRDPKDEKYINLAIETKANYIVSRDNDLLDLMTDFTDEAKDFRQRFRGLKIVDPIEFLRIVRESDLSLNP